MRCVQLYRKHYKRIFDLLLSILALIVLGIPMMIIAAIIRIILGSPVIYKQKRIGKDNCEFILLKFRTMSEARDENGVYLPDPQRLKPFGRFLRSFSIDELPSLINIIKGDMSIIGPRPLPVRYLPRFTKEQLRRHEVRPGLSNRSVVNGRNNQSWEEQFDIDVWYVDHVSFLVDLKSIVDTVFIVFNRKGATFEDGDSRYEFIGLMDVPSLVDDEKNYIKLGG